MYNWSEGLIPGNSLIIIIGRCTLKKCIHHACLIYCIMCMVILGMYNDLHKSISSNTP